MPNDTPSASILNDLPTPNDALDFGPYVATLAHIIASPTTYTPLTIGVFGTWGSGKTSLMRMMRDKLPPNFRVAWFDAWKYEKEVTLWRALLLSVLAALRNAVPKNKSEDLEELDNLEMALYQPVDREKIGGLTIDWRKLGLGLGGGAVQVGLEFLPTGSVLTNLLKGLGKIDKSEEAVDNIVSAIQRQRTQIHIKQVQFLEQFHDRFNALVAEHIQKKNLRLVVFVDDLDRCLPEKAVEVLEAIKLFVDVPGCVFVLGLDQEVIARGIEIKYREFGWTPEAASGQAERRRFLINGARYLEKIIQLPFHIPPIERSDLTTFVTGLVTNWPHPACPEVFAEGMGENPRQVKRTVNVFLLLWRLAEERVKRLEGRIKPIRLAKIVAIQHIYPELYEVLKETPRLLRELEDYYRANLTSPPSPVAHPERALSLSKRKSKERQESGKGPSEGGRSEPPPALASFIARAAVRRILTLHAADMPDANFTGLLPDELRLYFTLTRRAEAPPVAHVEATLSFIEPPMVRVPVGPFLMGTTDEQAQEAGLEASNVVNERPTHTIELPEYFIGKYPVTNAEYQAFVREAGYAPPAHWDGDKYPDEKGDHPVVNVSWRNAVAYCQWLSDRTGKTYRLPTEAEWEKAARGTDGRIYPWGNKYDPKMLNSGKDSGEDSSEGRVGNTTSVGQYSPAGDSPYGCADMAGNVGEWCSSLYKPYPYWSDGRYEDPDANGVRSVRGGADPTRRECRAARRIRGIPGNFHDRLGFRVACSP